MQSSQKFLFDRDFDLEKAKQKQLEQQAVQLEQEEVEILPPVVAYTQEELELAKQESYQDGLRDGAQKAEEGQTKILVGLIDRIGQKLHSLLEQEEQREKESKKLALQSALYMVKKFWPKVQQFFTHTDMEDFISTCLAENSSETRIVLRVNDSELDKVAELLSRIKEIQDFQGKVITLSDGQVMAGDCKIEWADGGAEKLSRYTMQQVEQLMDRVLSSLSTQGHVNSMQDQNDQDERGS
jgi:flagellar assembly protein FliH